MSEPAVSPALDLSLFGAARFRYASAAILVMGAAFAAMLLGGILSIAIDTRPRGKEGGSPRRAP